MSRHGTQGSGLADKVVVGQRLDSIISEGFSNVREMGCSYRGM